MDLNVNENDCQSSFLLFVLRHLLTDERFFSGMMLGLYEA